MRIVYFAHSVLNRGGDKMVLAHLGHLAANGHEVTIRSNRIDTGFAIHPRIRIESPSLGSKAGTLLCAALEKQSADCVVASIVPTAVLLALRNRGKVLHFAQDDNETAYRPLPARLLMRSLYRAAFSLFRLPTVAVSQALAESFRLRFSANCAAVANGVDTAEFYPDPRPELVASKGGRKALLLLARRDPRKGFDLGLQAVASLSRAGRIPFEVWTVGETAEWPADAPPHREFGPVDQKTLRGIMSSADLFLSPSRSEGFPLMVLEAFACGCPVVTTSAVTFASDGENALVSGIGDAQSMARQVERLLEDRHLARRLAEGALRFARAHTLRDSSIKFEAEIGRLFPHITNHGLLCKKAATKN